MRKTKMLFGAILALCLMAFSAQAASAATINGPSPFNASNTGPAAGQHVFSVGGTLVVRCTTMTVTNATHNGVGGQVFFVPVYTGCNANIGGVPFPATVTTNPNCTWTLSSGAFNAATGQAPGTLRLGDGFDDNHLTPPQPDRNLTCPDDNVVKVDIGANCDVFVHEQTITNGLVGQNLNSANAATPPAAGPPAHLLLTANVSGVWGSSVGCPPGVPTFFTNGTYAGKMYATNHWLS